MLERLKKLKKRLDKKRQKRLEKYKKFKCSKEYITGDFALSKLGAIWHVPTSDSEPLVAGKNFLSLEEIFKDKELVIVDSQLYASRVRAYTELAFSYFLEGRIPPERPEDILLEDYEIKEIYKYLKKSLRLLDNGKREKLLKWIDKENNF